MQYFHSVNIGIMCRSKGAKFEVLTLSKIQVFWDVTRCRLVNSYRRFEVLLYLQLQFSAVQEEWAWAIWFWRGR